MATPEAQAILANPCTEETFLRSKLDHAERHRGHHARVWALHRDLLKLRREEPTFRRVQRRGDIDGAALNAHALALRYFGADNDDRLLIVNFGVDYDLDIAPEPLLAPPFGMRWSLLWSSEHPKYGGSGTPPPETEQEGWFLTGRSAVVLRPLPQAEAAVESRAFRNGA
jgi:maltooligosyltrehalose trehalohydrolase